MPARISPTIDSRLRPRRYFSVSLIATRWARWPAIRPMPRSVSSGRSPAVPMIAVTGAARPAAPPAIPSATSRIALTPASLWAKSTITTRDPSRNRLSRPGDRSDEGWKSASPSRSWASVTPRPARGAGRGEGVRDVVASQPAEGDRDAVDLDDLVLDGLRPTAPAAAVVPVALRPAATVVLGPVASVDLDEPAVAEHVAAPARRHGPPDGREAPRLPDREHRDVRPQPPCDRRDERIVGVQDGPAARSRRPGDRRLHLGELGQRVDPLEVEVVRRDVRDHAGVVRLVAHPAEDQPAARRLEDADVDVGPARGSARRRRAPSSRPARPSARRRAPRRTSSSRPAGRRPSGCG